MRMPCRVEGFTAPSQCKPQLTLLWFPYHLETSLLLKFQGTEGIPQGWNPVSTGGSVLQHGEIWRSFASLQRSSITAAFKQRDPTGFGEYGVGMAKPRPPVEPAAHISVARASELGAISMPAIQWPSLPLYLFPPHFLSTSEHVSQPLSFLAVFGPSILPRGAAS